MLLLSGFAFALPLHGAAPCATLELRRAHLAGAPPRVTPVPHAADSSLDTEHFHIEGAGGHSPTEAELTLLGTLLEEVWAAEIDGLGYREPEVAEGERFPVYLERMNAGLYGYTDVDRAGLPYLAINADMDWAGTSTEDAWRVTAAHEFFHAVQFAYDYWEASWWMEATAVWMEDVVYDDLDDYLYYVSDDQWPDYPEVSMVAENGWHEYGEAVWARYLDEQHGGPATIQASWEAAESADGVQLLHAVLGSAEAFEAAVLDFQVRAALGYAGMEEGEQWWPVYRTDLVADASGLPATAEPTEWRPDHLGVNYFRVPLPETEPHALEVEFAGDPLEDGTEVRWQVAIVGTDGAEWEVVSDVTRATTTVRLPDVGTRWHEAWVLVGILSENTGVNHDLYDSLPRYTEMPPTFRFTASLAAPDEGDTGDTGDSGGQPDGGDSGDPADPDEDSGGAQAPECGCAGVEGGPLALGALAGVGLLRRRRGGAPGPVPGRAGTAAHRGAVG